MNDIACPERMARAAVQSGPHVLAGTSGRLLVDHGSVKLQHAFAALHEHEIDDVVVLFGKAVGIAIEEPDAMVAEVGEGLAAGMIRPDLLRQRRISPLQLVRLPQPEVRRVSREDGRREQDQSDKTNANAHGTSMTLYFLLLTSYFVLVPRPNSHRDRLLSRRGPVHDDRYRCGVVADRVEQKPAVFGYVVLQAA